MLRNQWLLNLAEYQPNQLLFLDESAANECTKDRKYGWSSVGVAPHVYQSIKRTERWSLLPVYTIDSFFNWEIIQGSFTAELFNAFVENSVLPFCNPYPGPRSVLVIDNAKIHHNEVPSTLILCFKPANSSEIDSNVSKRSNSSSLPSSLFTGFQPH